MNLLLDYFKYNQNLNQIDFTNNLSNKKLRNYALQVPQIITGKEFSGEFILRTPLNESCDDLVNELTAVIDWLTFGSRGIIYQEKKYRVNFSWDSNFIFNSNDDANGALYSAPFRIKIQEEI